MRKCTWPQSVGPSFSTGRQLLRPVSYIYDASARWCTATSRAVPKLNGLHLRQQLVHHFLRNHTRAPRGSETIRKRRRIQSNHSARVLKRGYRGSANTIWNQEAALADLNLSDCQTFLIHPPPQPNPTQPTQPARNADLLLITSASLRLPYVRLDQTD